MPDREVRPFMLNLPPMPLHQMLIISRSRLKTAMGHIEVCATH